MTESDQTQRLKISLVVLAYDVKTKNYGHCVIKYTKSMAHESTSLKPGSNDRRYVFKNQGKC